MKKRLTLSPAVWLSVLLALILAFAFWPSGSAPEQISYTAFETLLESGQVESVDVIERANQILGTEIDGSEFRTSFLGENAEQLYTQISAAENNVDLTVSQPGRSWFDILLGFLPVLIFAGLIVWIFTRYQSGKGNQFGKTQAKKAENLTQVTFADVAGADEAVEELAEIKEFLQEPSRFYAMGAKIPKGVLLYGPPGTGKTLLARAVAGEAGVPFFSISGSDFVEMFVGVGASRVRDLFAKAKEEAPAIIFIDEIDAVGRHRGAGVGGGHDEREQTLNQMLVEMDGFDATSGVILMAATNRPDILDPALLRPGRFDRQIVVDRPDLVGREQILGVHAGTKPLGRGIELNTLARRTPGFTGADLANLMNEAALLATRRDHALIEMDDLEEAIDRVMAGPQRKSRVMSDHERRVIAYHEAGHALVGRVLQHTDPIHKVSIVARGRALGWTLALPEHDKYLRTRSQIVDELAMLLGGRAAEEMIFGDPTTGASDDIDRVSSLARAMVTEYGMSDRVGPQKLGAGSGGEVFLGKEGAHQQNYSEHTARKIDAEVENLIRVAAEQARVVLTTHRNVLDELAENLLEHETLDRDALDTIFEGIRRYEANVDLTGAVAAPAQYGLGETGPVVVAGSDFRAAEAPQMPATRSPEDRLPQEPPHDRGPRH